MPSGMKSIRKRTQAGWWAEAGSVSQSVSHEHGDDGYGYGYGHSVHGGHGGHGGHGSIHLERKKKLPHETKTNYCILNEDHLDIVCERGGNLKKKERHKCHCITINLLYNSLNLSSSNHNNITPNTTLRSYCPTLSHPKKVTPTAP